MPWLEAKDGEHFVSFVLQQEMGYVGQARWFRNSWQRGVPVNTVQAWLGHADLETTAIYTTYLGMGIDLGAYEKMNNG